jgi:hypothetical protein
VVVVLLAFSATTVVLLMRSSLAPSAPAGHRPRGNLLFEMLLATEGPALRDYLQRSANPSDPSDQPADRGSRDRARHDRRVCRGDCRAGRRLSADAQTPLPPLRVCRLYDELVLEGRRLILIVGGLSAALAAMSCGNEKDAALEAPGVASVVTDLQRSFADGDVDGVCAGMTKSAKDQAGLMAHGEIESCQKDMRQAMRLIEKGGGFRNSDALAVTAARRDSDSATVTVALDGWKSDVPLIRRSGRWKLNSFFGIPTKQALRTVKVRDRVPPTTADDIREGEELLAVEGKMRITILTGFGDFKFSDCEFTFRSKIGRDRRTWTYGFDRDGAQDSACGDIEQCGGPDPGERYRGANLGGPTPWPGRLRDDGDDAYVHDVAACFWTCVGFFEGKLSVRLVRDGSTWRTETEDLQIGNRGLRLQGSFTSSSRLD